MREISERVIDCESLIDLICDIDYALPCTFPFSGLRLRENNQGQSRYRLGGQSDTLCEREGRG